MAWTKLDDRFWSHPKVMGLSDRAFRLYVMSLNWSVAHLTDGRIPLGFLSAVGMRPMPNRFTAELVDAGLWISAESGLNGERTEIERHLNGVRTEIERCPDSTLISRWVIHDYEQYQPTKEAITQLRQRGADRQRRFRDSQSATDVTRYKRVSNGDVPGRRPDPTRKTTPKGVAKPSKSDPVFDAVYEATTGRKWEPGTKVTAAARGRMNTAAKQLRDIGATPDQVTAAATRYRDEWPDMELTPMALVTNWDRFTGEVTARCNHRWSDGRTAWSLTTRGGTDLTRCDKCGEVKP